MQTAQTPDRPVPALCIGEVVEVRSPEEILATLDENGELDGLPFMPEMLRLVRPATPGRQARPQALRHHRLDRHVPHARTRCTWKGRAATGRRTAAARRAATSTGRRPGSSGSRPANPHPSPTARPSRAGAGGPLHAGDADSGDAPPGRSRRSGRGAVRVPGDRAAAGRTRAHPVVGRQAVRPGRPLGQRRRAGHDPHGRRRTLQRVPGRQPAPAAPAAADPGWPQVSLHRGPPPEDAGAARSACSPASGFGSGARRRSSPRSTSTTPTAA